MSTRDFSVVTADVRQAAANAVSVADGASGVSDHAGEITRQIAAAHRGWSSATALDICLAAWRSRLAVLFERVDQIGQKLMRTAGAYEQADAAAEAMVKRVGMDMRG